MAAQLPDKIKINEEWRSLFSNPLEQYWEIRGKRPAFCPLEECTRGYIATWEIIGKELFLTGIQGDVKMSFALFGAKTKKATLQGLFARFSFRKITRIKAHWYSGRLRIPLGKMTRFDDQGYDSRFEGDMIVTVSHGNIIRIVTLDNSEHKVIEE